MGENGTCLPSLNFLPIMATVWESGRKFFMAGVKCAALMLITTTLLWFSGPASAQEWRLLGSSTYEPQVQRSTINVGGDAGTFKALRLDVKRNDAEILDLKVVYGNGTGEDIQVRQTFKTGTSSRVIDLKGRDRIIKQIIVTYYAHGPVQLLFYGIPSGTIAAQWATLGCRDVGFLIDRDVIGVGGAQGAFSRVRLRVRGNRIEVFNLRLYYGNGQRDDIPVKAVIPDGGQSGPLDLEGNVRAISKIELIYRSQPNFKGHAQVCVDGLQKS
jgi:hypothetical protein